MRKRFITEKEVSAITGRAIQTLRNDRFKGQGFPYVKFGKSIRYDEDVILAKMEEMTVQTNPIPKDIKNKTI
jgi:hypothetical protein